MLFLSPSLVLRRFGAILPLCCVVTGACGGAGAGADLFASDGAAGVASGGGTTAAGSGPKAGSSADDEPLVAGSSSSGSGPGGTGAGGTSTAGSGGGGDAAEAGTAGRNPGEAGSGAGGAPPEEACEVSDIVTSAVFDELFPPEHRAELYTYQGFIEAAAAYPDFGTQGDCDSRKRDIAAFFANVAHQTTRLKYIEQINKPTQCASTVNTAPCAPGKKYFGRGPMQITWNYNYHAASACLGLGTELLTDPDAVTKDAVLSWRTGLWFWNTGGANRCQGKAEACASPPDTSSCDSPHNAMVTGKGFGVTVDIINGAIECAGDASDSGVNALSARVCLYQQFAELLGTTAGPGELSCGPKLDDCR